MCQKATVSSFFSMSSLPRLTKQQLENAVLKFEERYQFKYRMSASEATMLYNTPNPVGGMVLSKHEFLFFMQNGLYTQDMLKAWNSHIKFVKAEYEDFLKHSNSLADRIYYAPEPATSWTNQNKSIPNNGWGFPRNGSN